MLHHKNESLLVEPRESTLLDGQVDNNRLSEAWWLVSNDRRMLKVELEPDLEDDYAKSEYSNSFGYDSPLNEMEVDSGEFDNIFPLPINPQFNLQIQLQVSNAYIKTLESKTNI